METSRKRHLEEDEVVASKKRVTSSGQVQVQVNGRDPNEVEMPTDENLEVSMALRKSRPILSIQATSVLSERSFIS
jgi:hypothetical protein